MKNLLLLIVIIVINIRVSYSQTHKIIIQNGHSNKITALTSNGNEFATVDETGLLIIWDGDSKLIKEKHQVRNIPFAGIKNQELQFSANNQVIFFNTHDFTDFRNKDSESSLTFYNRINDSISFKTKEEQNIIQGANNNIFFFYNEFFEYNNTMLLKKSYLFHQKNIPDSGIRNIGNIILDKRITCISASENSKHIALGFEDGTVKLFKTKNFELLWEEKDYEWDIFNMVFIPEKNQIAYCGKSGGNSVQGADFIIVRNVDDGRKIKVEKPKGNDNKIEKVIISSDGKYLAANAGFPLIIWNTDDYKVIYNKKPSWVIGGIGNFSAINDLSFIPEKNEIILCSDKSIYFFDIKLDLYSSNFNYATDPKIITDEINFIGDHKFCIFNRKYRSLDIYNMNNLDRASFDFAFWSSLLREYAKTDTTINTLGFPSLWGGNIISWTLADKTVDLWGTTKYDTEINYFLKFDINNKNLISACGPVKWNKEQQDKYFDFMHYDSDKNYLIFEGNIMSKKNYFFTKDLYVLNSKTGKEILHEQVDMSENGYKISPDNNYLGFIDENQNLKVYTTKKFKEIINIPIYKGANNNAFKFLKDNQIFYATISKQKTHFISVNLEKKKFDTLFSVSDNNPTCLYIKDTIIALGLSYDYNLDKWKNFNDETFKKSGIKYYTDYHIILYDFKNDSILYKKYSDNSFYTNVIFNDKIIIAKQFSQGIELLPIKNKKVIKHNANKKEDIFYTENYYKATKGIIQRIGININDKVYPVENFDLIYNRPDKILEDIGYAEKDYLAALKKSRLKRFNKNNINPENVEDAFAVSNFPLIKFINKDKLKSVTDKEKLNIEFMVYDSLFGVSQYQIFINNIPLYENSGKIVNTNPKKIKQLKESIILTKGNNNIKIVCTNKNNIKSFADFFSISYQTKDVVKPSIYLVTIGISEYMNKSYTLKYAAKDAADIQKLYCKYDTIKSSLGYEPFIMKNYSFPDDFIDTVYHLQITNKQAVKKNILKLKTLLENSTEEDIVMIFLSGHGLLDNKDSYYFAAYDINFENPSAKGISYEEIISLLEGIPARKRILFMDTCHSGDLDEDNSEDEETINILDKRISISNTKGARVEYSGTNKSNYSSFDLMKDMFIDFNYKGTIVVSASGGLGFALEDDKWANGVFTYALISGIKDMTADINMDRKIMISELKQYIFNQVNILTKGKQKPTAREENIEFDFRIW